MSLAGKTYSFLMQITCIAHLLHNYTMQVRAYFKNIGDVVAMIKAAAIKNKDRKKNFHEVSLPSPPDFVFTRRLSWLGAASGFSKHFPSVCTIVNNWTGGRLLAEQ